MRELAEWAVKLQGDEGLKNHAASSEGGVSGIWVLRGVPFNRYQSPRNKRRERRLQETPVGLDSSEGSEISFLTEAGGREWMLQGTAMEWEVYSPRTQRREPEARATAGMN